MSDIADRLGVSTVTVSKALADQKGVSEEMRDKIKALALEMGYKSFSAQKGDVRSSYHIGILMEETYVEKYATFYWEMYQKLSMEAVKEDCFGILEVLPLAAEEALEEPKMLQVDKIDGLIVLGSVRTGYLKMLEEKARVPFVCMDFYDDQVKGDCVVSNSFYGAYHVTSHLLDMGHRDIGFVGTVWATGSIMDRFLGYQKAMLERGLPIRKDWILPDRDQQVTMFDQIPLPEELPTAFVCNCDLTASILIRTLRAAGKRVPEDISVTGYDDFLHPGLCDVGITTYSVDMAGMAAVGIRMLVKKIRGEAYWSGMQVIDGHLVLRESVARR